MTTGLRKGRALAILWAEVPAAHHTDVESWAASEPLAPTDPAVGVLAVGRYAGISGAPAFIEVHELVSDDAMVVAASGTLMATTLRALERFGATLGPAARPASPADRAPAPWGPRASTARSFRRESTSGAAIHGLPPALRSAASTSRAAHEDEVRDFPVRRVQSTGPGEGCGSGPSRRPRWSRALARRAGPAGQSAARQRWVPGRAGTACAQRRSMRRRHTDWERARSHAEYRLAWVVFGELVDGEVPVRVPRGFRYGAAE